CAREAATACQFFGPVCKPPTLEDALDLVSLGKVEATVMDGVFLDWYQQHKPKHFGKLKVLLQSDPFPATVIVYHAGGLEDGLVHGLANGLLNAPRRPRGRDPLPLCQLPAFERIPNDSDRLLDDTLKAYPPPADK